MTRLLCIFFLFMLIFGGIGSSLVVAEYTQLGQSLILNEDVSNGTAKSWTAYIGENPAQLDQVTHHQVHVGYRSTWFGYNQSRIGWVFPLGQGGVGVDVTSWQANDLILTDRDVNNLPAILQYASDSVIQGRVSAGWGINSTTALGVRAVVESRSIANSSYSTLGLDFGISSQPWPAIRLGVFSTGLIQSGDLIANSLITGQLEYFPEFGSILAQMNANQSQLSVDYRVSSALHLVGKWVGGDAAKWSLGGILMVENWRLLYTYSRYAFGDIGTGYHTVQLGINFALR